MEGIFWLDGFEGECKGGLMFRAFDLNKFINKVQDGGDKVIGIKFDGSNNVEFITETKQEMGEGNCIYPHG